MNVILTILPEIKLSYHFDRSNRAQASSFIVDYDFLALKNKCSSEEKLELFPNHLKKDTLSWYLHISPDHKSNWKDLKTEFMRNYCTN